jgi:chlorophyllide a reductase subunit Y
MAAGNKELLEKFEKDYPKGPHDQPQSMCPAFGSLRVGLRMRTRGTILSGSACCVYGLTFTSHFYGAGARSAMCRSTRKPWSPASCLKTSARRSTRWPIRTPMTPSSSPICACRPPRAFRCGCLPKEINGVRIVGIDVPGFGVPTHAEAKDVLAGAMLPMRTEAERPGPGARPRPASRPPDGHAAGRDVPRRSGGDRQAMLEPMGLAAGPVVPVREWRELYAALDCAAVVAAIHPFYTASVREFQAAGPRGVGSAPVGLEGTAAWLQAIGESCNVPRAQIDAARNAILRRHPRRAGVQTHQGPHHAVRL